MLYKHEEEFRNVFRFWNERDPQDYEMPESYPCYSKSYWHYSLDHKDEKRFLFSMSTKLVSWWIRHEVA